MKNEALLERPRRRGRLLVAVLMVAVLMAVGAFLTSEKAASTTAATRSESTSIVRAVKPDALFIGDSYTAGVGATSFDSTFATLVSIERGWVEVNAGYGGTGYLATAGQAECGQRTCPNFAGALSIATKTDPSIVVISGGRNDISFGLKSFQAAVENTLTRARALFPDARIYVTTPLWDDRKTPSFITDAADVVCQAARNERITCLRLGQPLLGHASLISDDGIHPDDAGHAAIARALIDALKAAAE